MGALDWMSPKPELEILPELAPQSLGAYEGAPTDEVKEILSRLRKSAPDVAPPGISPLTGARGESYSHFLKRLLPAIHKMMGEISEDASQIDVIVAHSSDMRSVRAWALGKFNPHYTINPSHLDDVIGNNQVDRLYLNRNNKWMYDVAIRIDPAHPLPMRSIYLWRHGNVEWSTPRKDSKE
jgi:broad specificity phosphatase PhoE